MATNIPSIICLRPEESQGRREITTKEGYRYVYVNTDADGNNCYKFRLPLAAIGRRKKKRTTPTPSCPTCICNGVAPFPPFLPFPCVNGVLILPNGGGGGFSPPPPYFVRLETCENFPILPIRVYTVTGGTLPPGITFTTLGGSGAQFTGIPTMPGTYTFQITLTVGGVVICTPTFSITISPP